MSRDYKNGAQQYLNSFATSDEIWLYYYNVRSMRNNQV